MGGAHSLILGYKNHSDICTLFLFLAAMVFFGSRICQALSKEKNIHLLITGRHADQARSMAQRLGLDLAQGLAV